MPGKLDHVEEHLKRLDAVDVRVELDNEFEPQAGTLVKVSYGGAFWHLLPGNLTQLLALLPDGAGGDAVKQAIESKAQFVWHGPSPRGSRDT